MTINCIFCKIVAGDIPSTRIYEDEHIIAFMDISPIIHGHALVIPKLHYKYITDTPAELLGRCLSVAKRVAQAQVDVLGADGVNLHQANGSAAGQVVPHIHFHIIPRFRNDDHHWNWNHKDYDSVDAMNEIGNTLKNAIT